MNTLTDSIIIQCFFPDLETLNQSFIELPNKQLHKTLQFLTAFLTLKNLKQHQAFTIRKYQESAQLSEHNCQFWVLKAWSEALDDSASHLTDHTWNTVMLKKTSAVSTIKKFFFQSMSKHKNSKDQKMSKDSHQR